VAGSDKTVKVTLIAVASPYAKGMTEASAATKRLGSDIDSVGAKSKGFASSAGQAAGALKGMAVAGAAVAGTALVAFLGDAVKAAGDLEQSVGGVDAVFKDSAQTIHDFGKNSAENVGLSTNAFNELITVTGAMLKNKGLDNFAQKSLDLVQIGADLSATYGGSAKEAVEALNAAMRGESDPIERYGISINETAVQAELAAKGLSKLTGQQLEQAKAQARIDIITRQSADALGKFAGEADTLQGQQQRLNAEWENAKASLGGALLPALTKVVSGLRAGVDVVVSAVNAWQSLPGPVQAAVAALIAFRIAQGTLGKVGRSAIDIVKALGEAVGYAADSSKRAGGGFAGAAAGIKTFTGGAGLAAGAANGLKSAGSALMGLAGGPWGIAMTGLTVAVMGYFQAQENAKRAAEEFGNTLDKTTGKFTDASRELITNNFFKDFSQQDYSKVADSLDKAGVGVQDLIAAYQSGDPAQIERFKQAFDSWQGSADWATLAKVDINALGNAYAAAGRDIQAGSEVAKVNADTQGKVAAATKSATTATQTAVPVFDSLAAKQKAVAEYAKIAADANKQLASALLEAQAAAGDADAAEIAYQRSLDAATQAIKDNGKTSRDHGKTLDITTKKGQDNASALLDLKDAALRSAEANLKNGDSAGKVTAALSGARAEFVKTAQKMGLSKAAAEALATKYGYTKETVDNLNKSMGDTPKKVASKVEVETAAAKGAITVVNTALDFLDGRVVWVTVRAAVADAATAIQGIGRLVAGSTKKKANGGPIYGPGSATSDSVPAMLSNGEYVIKAAAVQKYGLHFFDKANSMRLASGGPVQKFASGGAVRAPLDQFYGDYITGLGERVSAADLVANRKAITEATKKLHLAEMKLDEDRRKKKRSARQIATDELAVAKARDAVSAASSRAAAAQSRYNAQLGNPVQKFGRALGAGIRDTGAFIANIQKLSSRGYVGLAQQLAQMSNEDAEKIAAQAAVSSNKTVSGLQSQVNTAATQQSKLDHIDTIAAILGQVRSKNLTARQMASSTGIDVMEILDAAALIRGDLSKNRNASKLLADLAKRSKGQLFSTGGAVFGAGSATSDSIPAWLSNGEYVVKSAAVSKYGRSFFDALNGMRFSSARIGGSLSIDYDRLAAAVGGGGDQITLNAHGADADAAVRRVQRDLEFRRMIRLG